MADVVAEALHKIHCARLVAHEPGSTKPYIWPCARESDALARRGLRLVQAADLDELVAAARAADSVHGAVHPEGRRLRAALARFAGI
jgi:hypothetical protein